MTNLRFPLLLALFTLHYFCPVIATERDAPFKINIGFFKFPLVDPDIRARIREVEHNLTCWEDLYRFTRDYWDNNTLPLPDEVEENALRQFGRDSGVNLTDLEILLQRAKEGYDDEVRKFDNAPLRLWEFSRTDLSEIFLDEIDKEFKELHHEQLAAYAGVGSPVDCSHHINRMLSEMSEWEKAGMAAASTLMALLPTFLAFGSLFVPRSSEAFATSWLIGLGAALFSLGLPVRSLSCIRRKQVLELAILDKDPLDTIADLGSRDSEDPNTDATGGDEKTPEHTLEDLQKWTRPNPPETYMRDFGRIRKAVDAYGERWHWWHVPALFIAACQGIIFGFAIEPLLKAAGIPKFIFACADVNWTGLYLSVSAIANALFRLALWQLCDHEIVSVYHLSESAKEALEAIKKPGMRTTATQLPPLYPPILSKLHSRFGRLIQILAPNYQPLAEEHPRGASSQPIRDRLEYARSVLANPMSMLRSGFTNTAAAPRWRPLIVLIHLSTQGRPQLRTLMTGFCEAALLLVLTFFFASQWGGNLYITSVALALMLIFITVGRALAIIYVWLSARTWGLHAINCDEQDEILGCLRIVCSMEGVLVTVNGAHYYDGYRLDYEPEFKDWRKKYAVGTYDGPVAPPASSAIGHVQVMPKLDQHSGQDVV